MLPAVPAEDVWLGVDRRTRARGLAAMANLHELQPETAHAILLATLSFLNRQVERAKDVREIGELVRTVGRSPT